MAVKKQSVATQFMPTPEELKLSPLDVMSDPIKLAGKAATQELLGAMAGLNQGQPDAQEMPDDRSVVGKGFDAIGKAFKSIASAMSTPGFTDAMAKLGYNLAYEGSPQKAMGATAIALSSQRNYSNYVNKLLTGQQPTAEDMALLTPEQITQGRAMADTKKKIALEERQVVTGELSQKASQAYMEKQTAAMPTSYEERLTGEERLTKLQATYNKPHTEQWIDGKEIVTSQWNPETMGWTELSRGIPTQAQTAQIRASSSGGKGGLTPGQEMTRYRYNYNKFQSELAKEYSGKGLSIMQDANGNVVTKWESTEAKAEYMKRLQEGVLLMQQRGDLPGVWLTFPEYKSSAGSMDVTASMYATEEELIEAWRSGVINREEAIRIATEKGWN